MTKITIFERIVLFLIALVFGILSYLCISASFLSTLDEVSNVYNIKYLYALLFILLSFYAFYRKKRLSIFFWFTLAFFIPSYLATTEFSLSNLFSAIILLFWTLCYRFGVRLGSVNENVSFYFIKVILCFIIIPLGAYCLYSFFATDLFYYRNATDAFFFIMAYFPFVLLIEKQRLFKLVMIIAFSILAVLSFKRSIIIGFGICLLFYFLFSDKKRILSKWYSWLFIFIAIAIGYYVFSYFSDELIGRFSSLDADEGNGRLIIYNQTLTSFIRSDFSQMLFGHGYMSVRSITTGNRLAHNDLLEILYDFGIIGVTFYLVFIVSLFRKAFRLRRNGHNNTTVFTGFISSMVFFIVLSSLNCFIYSTMIISPIMLSFGISQGLLEKQH